MNCNLELGAKPTLSSSVWGWGSGYAVIAIEIKLQKQLTFHYSLGYIPSPPPMFMCVCVHTENNLWIQAFSEHRFLRNELRSSNLVAGIFYLLSLFICQPLALLSHYVALLSFKLPTCLSLSSGL